MKLSANQAAKEAGKTKKTILDAIKSTRMSASKNDKGHWEIEPSELFRVFPKTGTNHPKNTSTIPPAENHENRIEIERLRVELKSAHQLTEALADQVNDLRSRLDRESDERRQLTVMITDQRTGQGGKRGFLARMFGQ